MCVQLFKTTKVMYCYNACFTNYKKVLLRERNGHTYQVLNLLSYPRGVLRTRAVTRDEAVCVIKVKNELWDYELIINNSCQELSLRRVSLSLGENCALAASQSVDCRDTILFIISLISAKVWNKGFNWPVFGVGMHKKYPNVKGQMWTKNNRSEDAKLSEDDSKTEKTRSGKERIHTDVIIIHRRNKNDNKLWFHRWKLFEYCWNL